MALGRILVPTDFSWRSRRALAWAVAFSAGRIPIDVLYVAPAPSVARVLVDAYLDRPLPQSSPADHLDAEQQLSLFLTSAGDARALEPLVEHGDPAATIVRIAVERAADLIVMGTHARSGAAEALLGSVAHRVITCAPCPVLTLRGDEPAADLRGN
jgi:nucleotide-binding universal stress UspA family protein